MTHAVAAMAYEGGEPAAADGIVLESTYLWGVFRTVKAEPDIITSMRRLAGEEARWPAGLLLQTNAGATGLERLPVSQQSATSRSAAKTSDRPELAFDVPSLEGAQAFRFAITEHTAVWEEGSILSLHGQEVAPGLQWHVASDGGMHYRSRIFHVQGHVLAQEVAGFIGCDEVHLAPGRTNYVDDPITAGHLSDAWCTWGTAFDDGTIEAGHAAYGPDGFAFGLRATDGAAHVASAVSGTVRTDAAGCPEVITFDIDGEPWVFRADARGLPVRSLPGPVRQAEGSFLRAGERRTPVAWFATPEVPASPTGTS